MESLVQQFEANEIAAWRSIYQSPMPDLAERLGMGFLEHAGALLMWNRAAPVPILNRLVGLGVFAPADASVVDVFLKRSRAENCPCLVQLAPTAQPVALAEQLATYGLRQTDRWQLQYGAIPDTPSAGSVQNYQIEPVTVASAPMWADALLSGWQLPLRATLGLLALTIGLVQQPGWRCYAVIHQPTGVMAGGGAMYAVDGIAGFYLDTIIPAHRGRQLQTLLAQARLVDAHSLSCRYACAPSPIGGGAEHNLRRAGLDQAYERVNYVTERAAR